MPERVLPVVAWTRGLQSWAWGVGPVSILLTRETEAPQQSPLKTWAMAPPPSLCFSAFTFWFWVFWVFYIIKNGLIIMRTSFLLQPLPHAPSQHAPPSSPDLFQFLVTLPSPWVLFLQEIQPPYSWILLSNSLPLCSVSFCLWRELCFCVAFWFISSVSSGFHMLSFVLHSFYLTLVLLTVSLAFVF